MHPPHLRSVLAATDLSPISDEVLRGAIALAERAGAELHVLCVFPLPPGGAGPGGSAGFLEEASEALAVQLRRVGSAAGTSVHPEARFGSAAEVIVERAEQVSADLIVLGPHQGGTVEADFLGTTADRVIRTANAACLVVRGPLPIPPVRVGVPVDFSELARQALTTAIVWSRQLARGLEGREGTHSSALVVHVAGVGTGPLRLALEAEIRAALAATGGDIVTRVEAEILTDDDPAEAITRWAEDEMIDLIVMGTHGRSEIERALIGSVSSAVTRRAACPVLLVPPPRSAAQERSGPGSTVRGSTPPRAVGRDDP